MQQSLLISSASHFSLLFVMIFFGWNVNKEIDPLTPTVQVSVISISELDAKLSVAPDSTLNKLSPQTPIEENLMKAIYVRFGLPAKIPKHIELKIKKIDKALAWYEAISVGGYKEEEAMQILKKP